MDEEDSSYFIGKSLTLANGYALLYLRKLKRSIAVHRLILKNKSTKLRIDHINRDKLDNRKMNLRLCTPSENAANRIHSTRVKSSKFRGVTIDRNTGKIKAMIMHKGVTRVASFKTEEDAAKWYDSKSIEIYGKYAITNRNLNLF